MGDVQPSPMRGRYRMCPMPLPTTQDQLLLHIGTCSAAELTAISQSNTRYPMPMPNLIRQVTSDRLGLASWHLRAADGQLAAGSFRSSISRNYYAMYHSARAITFAETQGDDHEKHSVLPRHLPATLANRPTREQELTDARLLRNQADYDPYPAAEPDWEADARRLAVGAASFLQACEDHALANGLI